MSSYRELLQLIEAFETHLGNPEADDSLLTFRDSLDYDENEELAWPHIKMIQEWGFMDYLTPHEQGGKLTSLNELYFIVKSIARRDVTTAIALGLSFLAALPIWIAGSSRQKNHLAEFFRRGEIGAFALTEEEHGSDVAANELMAEPCEGGWELSGKKWCVNFATLGQGVTVLCRTHNKGGPLGFALFFLDKSQIKTGFLPIPKLPTHGVRGLDISGFSLDKVFLPDSALIGEDKRGLELIYKTLQITRTLCVSPALGGADTALRMTLSFCLQRHLYGKTAYEIPVVRQRLAEQFTYLLIADCTALAVVRACSVMPEKLSFWSAVIKFLIPKIAEDVIEQCSLVMGARGYLRTTEWSMFQKIRRDVQVVGLFDGSSQVNLSLIAGNLLPQAGMRGTWSLDNATPLEHVFNLKMNCPAFDVAHLKLFTHTEDDVFAGLTLLDSEHIKPLVAAVRAEIDALDKRVVHLKEQKQFEPRNLIAFRLAEQYCWIFAASCCLHFWHFNQELVTKDWITLALQLIFNKLHAEPQNDSTLHDAMAAQLVDFYEQDRMFSVLPIKIPG